MTTTGQIFNIMKYSTHDGPGIRTAVFFKGCPLKCQWCHNPESQAYGNEILLRADRCIGCKECAAACSTAMPLDKASCTMCGACTSVCHAGAREQVGKASTVNDIMKEIKKDLIFYEESGGGVTFSGGEPFAQPKILAELLRECKEEEIHTAVETCGYVSSEVLLALSKDIDLFLYDLKIMDEAKHRYYTGASNELILDNLRLLAKGESNVILRFPLIPGVNDDKENIERMGHYVAQLNNISEINILPYHISGVDKYKYLQKEYLLQEIKTPDEETIAQAAIALKKFGLKTKIGG